LNALLGTITGSEIKKNRDSDSNSRILGAEISSPEDIQTVELITGPGEDFSPEDKDVVLIISLGSAYKMGLIIDDQIVPDPSIEKGEKEIYSKLNGAKKAKIRLNKDSEIILNDGVDFAVSFNELKTQVDQLRTDLNAHVHTGITAGGANSGVPLSPFTVSVDGTKVEKVKL